MSKWEQKLDLILKEEKEKHKGVYELSKKIKEFLHGNTNIDTDVTRRDLLRLSFSSPLNGLRIEDISVEQVKENPQFLEIKISLIGSYNWKIHIKTSPGTMGNNREPIYYVSDYDCFIVSELQQRIKNYYITYKHRNVEKFIDTAMEKDVYLKFDTQFRNYTIWDSHPESYGDSITGSDSTYNEMEQYKTYYKTYLNLNQLTKARKVSEFAYDKLRGSKQTIDWYEYRL